MIEERHKENAAIAHFCMVSSETSEMLTTILPRIQQSLVQGTSLLHIKLRSLWGNDSLGVVRILRHALGGGGLKNL